MSNEFVSLQLHDEFAKRMQEEHDRQNYRIAELEKVSAENSKIILSIDNLANSMKSMADEQKRQGERLDTLEDRDGEMWRKAVGYVMTAIIGIVIGYIFKQLGM